VLQKSRTKVFCLCRNQVETALGSGVGMIKCQAVMRTALAWLVCCIGCAQTPEPQFDAASIKPSGPIQPGHFVGCKGGPGTDDPGRFTCGFTDLSGLIEDAYDIPYYRLSATNRLPETRFHLIATIPSGTSKEQFQRMMQNLLAERFKLEVHRESRETQMFRMVVGAGGPKLKPYVEGEPANVEDEKSLRTRTPGFYYHVQGKTMADFARLVSVQLGKPVTDATGLNGKYDFDLWWTFDEPPSDGPTMLSAIQSAGLKLESYKGQVEFVVVDHAEKMPAEN
jgi:uncharacterized protein (TIGR03435 family)